MVIKKVNLKILILDR